MIMTSVALIKAAAVWPGLSPISRAEVAVMIDVICCSPIEIFTSAISPLIAHTIDSPNELIPSADTAHHLPALGSCLTAFPEKQAIDFALGNSMVSSGGANALDLPRINPLFYCGKADSKLQNRFPQFEHLFVLLSRANQFGLHRGTKSYSECEPRSKSFEIERLVLDKSARHVDGSCQHAQKTKQIHIIISLLHVWNI
jgi:hypothetical protein